MIKMTQNKLTKTTYKRSKYDQLVFVGMDGLSFKIEYQINNDG